MSKFDWAGFFIFSLFLCHVTLNLAEMSLVKSRLSVTYRANLFNYFVLKQSFVV